MISQEFKAHVALETYVILGNDALVKCEIPSFVSDLVTINGWMDDENNEFFAQITGDYYDIIYVQCTQTEKYFLISQ